MNESELYCAVHFKCVLKVWFVRHLSFGKRKGISVVVVLLTYVRTYIPDETESSLEYFFVLISKHRVCTDY